jgi:hypothetical protein
MVTRWIDSDLDRILSDPGPLDLGELNMEDFLERLSMLIRQSSCGSIP